MKKYTQRELINEAWRDKLKGLAKVALAGAKMISPSGAALARGVKSTYDIYKSEDSSKDLKRYLMRPTVVYLKTPPPPPPPPAGSPPSPVIEPFREVSEREIIDGSAEAVLKDTTERDPSDSLGKTWRPVKANATKLRLILTKVELTEDLKDDIYRVIFSATSGSVPGRYIAYIDKTDKDKHEVIGIKQA